MNYKIDAIDILLNSDCILQKYYPLIQYKKDIINNLRKNNHFSKDECISLSDSILSEIGLSDPGLISLFRSFLVMYDVKPQKLREIEKICYNDDEKACSFRELYLLPGVKAVRASLYYEAGYRFLKDIACATPEQIINDTSLVILNNRSDMKTPLLKEVKTHIAVAKVYTYFRV